MDVTALERMLDEVFDHAVVYHGFTDYMRDYEVIVFINADARTGIAPVHLRLLFRFCVEADCRTTVRPDVWSRSLDERLLDHATGVDLDGYVWGVKYHCLYPGGQVIGDSTRTQAWAEAIGIDFHEVRLETNAVELTLVFSDLQVSELDPDYAPWRATD